MAINLLQSFANGFRLFRGEDLNKLVALLNGTAAMPSTVTVQAGAGAGLTRGAGNLIGGVQVNAAGVGNAAATTDTVLFTQALPASTFDQAGRQVFITGLGKFAANGNNKRVQIYVGTDAQTVGSAIVTTATTSIASSATVTQSGGGWTANAVVTKYGAAGSNTQLGANLGIELTGSHLGTAAPTALTMAENGVIYVSVTGASQTSGAANDVLGQQFEVFIAN